MDMQYDCYNAFPNLKSVPDSFFLEKALVKVIYTACVSLSLYCEPVTNLVLY